MNRKWFSKKDQDPVHCAIGDFHVSLRSELPEVLEDFVSLYPEITKESDQPDRTIHLEVRKVGHSRTGRKLYCVLADGQEIGGWRPHYGIFPLLEWGINLRIMETRSEFLQLHASSMSYQGNGIIFVGDSGCGKSTLAAILMANGWQYHCDEFALIDPNSFCLQAFPKALCIKEGSYPVIQKLGLPFARHRDYLKELKGRVGYINPRTDRPVASKTPSRVGVIVFPQYKKDTQPHVEPISRGHATLEMFRNCFNRHAFQNNAIDILTQLASQSQCYRLITGEPKETTRVLESLLNGIDAKIETPERTTNPVNRVLPDERPREKYVTHRRDVLRIGAKLAYVAPTILTLTASQAFAGASNPSGICSTALQSGELCATDPDCCSKDCDSGVCE